MTSYPAILGDYFTNHPVITYTTRIQSTACHKVCYNPHVFRGLLVIPINKDKISRHNFSMERLRFPVFLTLAHPCSRLDLEGATIFWLLGFPGKIRPAFF